MYKFKKVTHLNRELLSNMCLSRRMAVYYPHGKLELFTVNTVEDSSQRTVDFLDADYLGLCIVANTLVDYTLA